MADMELTQTIVEITRHEVAQYAGNTHDAVLHPMNDEVAQRYAVIAIPDLPEERPAWITVMARIEDDLVIIEEDTALDKPLVDALMVNGGIPREKIVLAYKGETIPEDK